jgi:hypothetical protein
LDGNDIQNFPLANVNFTNAHWIVLHASHDYTATLSDEYTDAEALANATVFTSNSKIAETFLATGYVSQWTSVNYKLKFTNLIANELYFATVTLRRSDGVTSMVPYSFTAAGTTHEIIDSVPNPPAGMTMEVRLPTVIFDTP